MGDTVDSVAAVEQNKSKSSDLNKSLKSNNKRTNSHDHNHINTVTATTSNTNNNNYNNNINNNNNNENNYNKNGAQTWNYHVLPSLYSVYQKVAPPDQDIPKLIITFEISTKNNEHHFS